MHPASATTLDRSRRSQAVAMLVLACVLWGGSFSIVKALIETQRPWILAARSCCLTPAWCGRAHVSAES